MESEEQAEKRILKNEQNLRDLCDTISRPMFALWESPNERVRERDYLKK